MKLRYLLICIMISFCMFVIKVDALSATIEISCDDNVIIGDSFLCEVKMTNISEKIYGIKFNYDIDKNLVYNVFSSTFDGEIINDKDGFNIVYEDGIDNYTSLGKLKLNVESSANVGDEYTIKLSDIDISNGEVDFYTTSSTKVKVIGSNIIENPTTGKNIYIVLILIIISLVLMFIYRRQKEVGSV